MPRIIATATKLVTPSSMTRKIITKELDAKFNKFIKKLDENPAVSDEIFWMI
jgi:hypothetical protein